MNNEVTMELATLGGGCFWCLEAVYENVRGVHDVVSGYAGGHHPYPTYEQVSTGTTGHAEVVQLSFDPATISYHELLAIFFDIHDPTTLNRQGADVGAQYRSAIFYHTEAQRLAAEALIAELNAAGKWHSAIVTQVTPLKAFYPAEPYHQQYFRRHPAQPYCRAVVAPKVTKLRTHFQAFLR